MKPAGRRRKGSRTERFVVSYLTELGLPAKRVPLSGAANGFKGDVVIDGLGTCEVKARKDGGGFVQLERWKGEHDVLVLKRDRCEPLVCVELGLFAKLLAAYLPARVALDAE